MDKGAPGVPQTESGGQASLGPNSRRNIWSTTKIRLLTPDKEERGLNEKGRFYGVDEGEKGWVGYITGKQGRKSLSAQGEKFSSGSKKVMIHAHILLIRGTFPLSSPNFVTVIPPRFSNAGVSWLRNYHRAASTQLHESKEKPAVEPFQHHRGPPPPHPVPTWGIIVRKPVVSGNKIELKEFSPLVVFDCSTGSFV